MKLELKMDSIEQSYKKVAKDLCARTRAIMLSHIEDIDKESHYGSPLIEEARKEFKIQDEKFRETIEKIENLDNMGDLITSIDEASAIYSRTNNAITVLDKIRNVLDDEGGL